MLGGKLQHEQGSGRILAPSHAGGRKVKPPEAIILSLSSYHLGGSSTLWFIVVVLTRHDC